MQTQPTTDISRLCIRYRDTGLYAIPSIHDRLVFAQMVEEACRRTRFDVIAVELPPSLRRAGLVEAVAAAGDRPHLFLTYDSHSPAPPLPRPPQGDGFLLPADAPATAPVCQAIALTPADSILAGIRCSLSEAHHQPALAFIDAEEEPGGESPRHKPDAHWFPADDYEAVEAGLGAFVSAREDRWQCRDNPFYAHRELVMARHLARLLAQGQRVLFICGAGHWKSIRGHLDAGRGSIDDLSGRPLELSSACYAMSPGEAWQRGWMDDFPALCAAFAMRWRQDDPPSFDKREEFERIFWRAAERTHGTPLSELSPRQILTVRHYLAKLLAMDRRRIPRLARHLAHAATACAGKSFAASLVREAMDYPFEGEARIRFLPLDEDRSLALTPDGFFVVRLPNPPADPEDHDLSWSIHRPRKFTQEEKEDLDSCGNYRVPATQEQELNRVLSRRARFLAHRMLGGNDSFTQPFQGGVGQGIDLRSTIRARSQGKEEIWVRHARHRHNHSPCNNLCPIVWIFDAHPRESSTEAGYFPQTGQDGLGNVYASFYWFSERRRLPESNNMVTRSTTAWSCILLRETAPFTLTAVKALIQRLPEARRCRVAPWRDPELANFHRYELAIACAVKHAGDHIVLVSVPRLRLSPEIRAFARARGVRILYVSPREFDGHRLWRFAVDHEVPAKGAYSTPVEAALRFVEPV